MTPKRRRCMTNTVRKASKDTLRAKILTQTLVVSATKTFLINSLTVVVVAAVDNNNSSLTLEGDIINSNNSNRKRIYLITRM